MGGGAGLKEDSWAERKPGGLVLVLFRFFKQLQVFFKNLMAAS